METLLLWTVLISGISQAFTVVSQGELYFFTPHFVMDKMIEESFDEELRNLTRGRAARSLVNEIDVEECTDNLGTQKCQYLRSFGSCFRLDMWASMKSMCRRTCKFCNGNPYAEKGYVCATSKYGCCPGSRTEAKGPNKEGCQDLCYDSYGKGFCKTAKKLGMCNLDKRRTFEGCFKTCGYCRPCKDIVPLKCKIAAKLNACEELRKSTVNYCRKTCNFCGKRDPCFGFVCKGTSQCVVGLDGKPTCMCKRNCNTGDKYTGKVCGRDGSDYTSICDLKQAFCKFGNNVYAKHFGSCKQKKNTPDRIYCKKTKDIDRCPVLVKANACKNFKERMMELCPHGCGFCKRKYQAPKAPCYYTKYGCCMDGVSVCRGPSYEGCPPCKDRLSYLCKRFIPACGDENNKTFMKMNCAKICHYCRSAR